MVDNPHIIGITGSFGSGCTYVVENILMPAGYQKLSLSAILRDAYVKEIGQDPQSRKDLQDFGDQLRAQQDGSFLANQAIESMSKRGDGGKPWVIDSIRNPMEVHALRDYSRNFYLLGVNADKEKRWDRVKGLDRYNGDRNAFDRDDERDSGRHSSPTGQRVTDCFYEADIVLLNEKKLTTVGNTDFKAFESKVMDYVRLVQAALSNQQAIKNEEAVMAAAYAISQRSSCLQRKVGAVITDSSGSIISSGFNEVPPGERPCAEEHMKCYRAKSRVEFLESLGAVIRDFGNCRDAVEKEFRERFRALDLCRALHAEENAIINLARHGRSARADELTLYTTTYPCRMCANRIAQLGISRVVYLEPYPDDEAKVILEGRVHTEFFEGITFRAYFRIYGANK